FRNQLDKPISFTVKAKGDGIQKILDWFNNVVYDGATNLSTSIQKVIDEKKYDFIILFSDGLDNLMDPNKQIPKFKSSVAVYPIVSASTSNTTLLKYIAQSTGGVVIDLNYV